MAPHRLTALAIGAALLVGRVHGHGSHEGPPRDRIVIPVDSDWAVRHMAEEHSILIFDAGSFFNLHDYDSKNEWTAENILKTYGLQDESNKHVSQTDKDTAVRKVLEIFDRDGNGAISFAEYTNGCAQGLKLPDLGYGPGHHGDDEYEYEQHHWNIYHDENTREEDLIHPEDIEHFRKHEEMELAEERQAQEDQMPIIERNIPSKFRRSA